ncbi:MAG: hypothetical protein K2Q06_00965 [Parvularculaceae bacterium]|nr:hypothetical protein [Parvularculaceae bacterium]
MVDAASQPTIRDLQDMAAAAASAVQARRPRRRGLSRAAKLHLVDQLSRSATAALAAIAGVSLYVAIVAGRLEPTRAALWLVIVLVPLAVARNLASRFRAGDSIAARPFLWRAQYSATVAVLSAAFGAGALIVITEHSEWRGSVEILAALFLGALVASLLHAAHGKSAAAIWAPTSLFCFLGAWRVDGPGLAFFGAAAMAAAGAAALYLAVRILRRSAALRFPRYPASRRSKDDAQDETQSRAADAS